MVPTTAPFVFDSDDSPFPAWKLTPRDLHNHHHGRWIFGGVRGSYRGQPQFCVTCIACHGRHVVRTARSMFNSREHDCGCGRVGDPARHEHRLLHTRFGELIVERVARRGRTAVLQCRCLCGRRGAAAHRTGPVVYVRERALRDGTIWACPDCLRRRAAAAAVPAVRNTSSFRAAVRLPKDDASHLQRIGRAA